MYVPECKEFLWQFDLLTLSELNEADSLVSGWNREETAACQYKHTFGCHGR